jgi:integrase
MSKTILILFSKNILPVIIQDQYLGSFLFALKTRETKRQYSRNLKLFFNFGFESSLSLGEQADLFITNAIKDANWTTNYFIQFFKSQIENRVNTNLISSATLKNYFKAAKLFCVMNDVTLNWLKITKGLPRVKYYSDDRAPTIEEVRKLLEYPDRRIKPIVYTMISSGIRIGAWDWLKWRDIIPITVNGNLIAGKIIVYSYKTLR